MGTMLLSSLKGLLSNIHRQGPKANIFLFSTPRSGSTFLMELLHAQPGMKIYDEPLWITNHAVASALDVHDWRTSTVMPNRKEVYRRYFQRLIDNRVPALNPRLHWRTGRLMTDRITFKILHGGEDMIGWFEASFKARILLLIRHPIPNALSHKQLPRLPHLLDQPALADLFTAEQIDLARTLIADGSVLEKGVLNWCLQNAPALARPLPPSWTVISYEDLTVFPEASFAYLRQRLDLSPIDNVAELAQRPSHSTQESDAATKRYFADHDGHQDRTFLISKWRDRVSTEEQARAFDILARFGIDAYRPDDLFVHPRLRVQGIDVDTTDAD